MLVCDGCGRYLKKHYDICPGCSFNNLTTTSLSGKIIVRNPPNGGYKSILINTENMDKISNIFKIVSIGLVIIFFVIELPFSIFKFISYFSFSSFSIFNFIGNLFATFSFLIIPCVFYAIHVYLDKKIV